MRNLFLGVGSIALRHPVYSEVLVPPPLRLLCDTQPLRPVHLQSGELTAQAIHPSPLVSRIARSIIADYV
jgi:hypothetical protein